jgi:hypothetical protein
VRRAARQHDEPQLLVVVDGHVRADVLDQPLQRAGLRLARGRAAREVGVERPPAAGPAEREVAVEVDAARVLARASADAIGVSGLDRPELDAGRRLGPAQPPDHRVAGALVAVDRADGEHPRGRRRIAVADDPQLASLGGFAVRRGAGRAGHTERDEQGDENFAHVGASC